MFLFPDVPVFQMFLFSIVPISSVPVSLFLFSDVPGFHCSFFSNRFSFFQDDPVCHHLSCFQMLLFQMFLFSDVPVFQCSCFSVPAVRTLRPVGVGCVDWY